ncbi:leucine-rich repeat-containing protein 46-like isoform X2 [Epinephelus moara]|uniref:leucine-rich repeat-containing protein 46-like isoform X2 n=1 Tax=Epinephelus moara TaxID=300413 RepID=UPI00214F180A|nr:leucine-rich repeat-containing protein 46-like isoform X2 [Epinephelus moara]
MSSLEEGEEVPDLQLSFVLGDSADKPQTPHILPEDAEPQELPESYSAETLYLSRTQLKRVPESILKNSSLKYLYLEGNQISSIPDSMFISLPNLLWLDLRNNQITSLPAQIGLHRSLRTVLLEGNPISELPPELELPAVEKLQLSELMGSSVEDESVDEDELQKFRELKHKMSLLDKAELGSTGQGDRNTKSRLPSVTKRKKATTKAGIIPELPLFETQHWKRPEEKRQVNQEALRKWRAQTMIKQGKKMSEQKKRAEQRKKKQEAETDSKPSVEDSSDTRQSQTSSLSITDCEASRSARELERKIRARVEKIHENRRNPSGTTGEHMAAAEQDVEEIRKLQARLLERTRNRGRDIGNCFTLFSADTWPSFFDK